VENLVMLKYVLVLITFYISTVHLSAQVPLRIEKAASTVFLSFSQDKSLPVTELEDLKIILNSEVDNIEFVQRTPFGEKEFATTKAAYDSLRNHFTMFETECKNIASDSALFLFNQWYLHFSNTFYDYCKQKFFSSPKTKIILFSASISCYCTLDMCKDQLIDILKFIKEKNNEYDYWIVDSYWHNELQIEYETFFAPSVIVFDGDNKVLYKIEYEEKMIEKLAEFLEQIIGRKNDN